jgi:hypothetical protein
VSESGLHIDLTINRGLEALVTAVVEEGGFDLVASGIDGNRGFGGIRAIRRESTEQVVGCGFKEVVLRFIVNWAGWDAGNVDCVDDTDEVLIGPTSS